MTQATTVEGVATALGGRGREREGEKIRDKDEKTNRCCARHDVVLYKVPVETFTNTIYNFCVLNAGTYVVSSEYNLYTRCASQLMFSHSLALQHSRI